MVRVELPLRDPGDAVGLAAVAVGAGHAGHVGAHLRTGLASLAPEQSVCRVPKCDLNLAEERGSNSPTVKVPSVPKVSLPVESPFQTRRIVDGYLFSRFK